MLPAAEGHQMAFIKAVIFLSLSCSMMVLQAGLLSSLIRIIRFVGMQYISKSYGSIRFQLRLSFSSASLPWVLLQGFLP
jgi:hypothetical protein